MRILDNVVTLFVIVIVGFILIPLSPFFLDLMFILNIALSILILLITMYVEDALRFSVFPSLLLITTLFRLALNISSIRLILTNSGNAGRLIATFGEFVLQGDVVVGFLIFIIIVLVNFMVITKGAERVSEVSARFKLDAMPGKQMAIDADLSAGLITEAVARQRRTDVQREAEFYGAMDGASKFVKGDAVTAIIITVINFVAGVIIGMVQGGATFGEVLTLYSTATVGAGLAGQIPALLVSTATGMMVTRSASNSTLGGDLTRQFLAQPAAFFISGALMAALCLIPGMPIFQLLLLAAGLVFVGFRVRAKMRLAPLEAGEAPAAEGASESGGEDIDSVYNLLPVEAIEMEFGYSLVALVDEVSGSSFIDRLVTFRKQFALEMGMVVPGIRLCDNGLLSPNQYVLKIKGEEVGRGEVLVDYYLALDPGSLTGTVDGIETVEPAYGIPSRWILPEKKEIAEIYGYTVIDPLSVLVTHLSETVRRHAWELLTRQDVQQMLGQTKKLDALLVEELVPGVISMGSLQKILCALLKEGVPIRDMESILTAISDHASSVRDLDVMTEYVRQNLKRAITHKWSKNGQIRVITLDAEAERVISNAITRGEGGAYLALDPQTTQTLVTRLMQTADGVRDLIGEPVILTSPLVRLYFSRLLEQFYPKAVVLSYGELDMNTQIQAVANLSLD